MRSPEQYNNHESGFKMKSLEELYSFENLQTMINEILGLIKAQEESNLGNDQFNIVLDHSKLFKKNAFSTTPLSSKDYFKQIFDYSLNLHHPRCTGYQLSVPIPITVAISFLASYLNNGMATYDSGPFATVAESKVIEFFLSKFQIGDSAGGFMTSGGTLGNLSALLYAREFFRKKRGFGKSSDHTKVILSSHCHYSIRQALFTMGMDENSLVEVDVDQNYQINIELVENAIAECESSGHEIMAVIGTAGSSSLGIYDDLESLGRLCASKEIWLHVDAAHGGAAIFSSKNKYLMAGIEFANSIVIDAHKLLMCPALSSVVLIREFINSNPYQKSSAPYLWGIEDEGSNLDLSKNTYECTKTMMSISLYSIIRLSGGQIFEVYLDRIFDLAQEFYLILHRDTDFEVPIKPMCNIVCFKWWKEDVKKCNIINQHIYNSINESGEFFIAKTVIRDQFYFRVSIMNAFTKIDDLIALTAKIREIYTRDFD